MKISPFSARVNLGQDMPAQRAIALSLQRLWERFCLFMTDKSLLTVYPEDCRSTYSQKVRSYPYLAAKEEQRDWLEMTLNCQNTHF
jgi:hypothetical protein